MSKLLEDQSVLITGGTGSLGSALVKRITTGEYGTPRAVIIYSRDELKQANMAAEYKGVDYIRFVIGDVRNYCSVADVIKDSEIIFHTAAMKRVESCERFPDEAVATNYMGASNIVRAIKTVGNYVECVIGVSSDKGAKPLNVYGMTKALQEHRLLIASKECPDTRFVCVRYGNVMGSRGSVIPIWQEQVKKGEPITITDPSMTRFLLSLNQAVDTLMVALETAREGEVYIPSLPAATIGDIACVVGGSDTHTRIIGRGRGEKMHETLITEDEVKRTIKRGDYYVVTDEVQAKPILTKEYVSSDYVLGVEELRKLMLELGVI